MSLAYAHIVQKEGVCGGRPTINGTRIEVASVALRHRRGESVDEILEAWPHLTTGQVYEALAYYFDHQVEMDAQIEQSLNEQLWMQKYPSGKRTGPESE